MISLVLSGGGSKGAFQGGVLFEMFDRIKFNNIFGTSVGSLNAIVLAQCYLNKSPELLKSLWTEKIKKNSDVISANYLKSIFLGHPFTFKPLKKLLSSVLDLERIIKMPETITMTTTDILSGQSIFMSNHDFKTGDELLTYMLASASMPPAFKPTELGDYLLVDGGVRENVPLKKFQENPMTGKIVTILCEPIKMKTSEVSEVNNILELSTRAIEIMMNEITTGDINNIILTNKLLKSYAVTNSPTLAKELDNMKGKTILDIEVIAPKNSSESETLEFNQKKMTKAFFTGIERAKEYMRKIYDVEGKYYLED